MNNVKKVIAVMTAGAMVLGVGAQGVFAESQEDEVVELIYWKSYNVDVYKDFINQFNEEHPNIHVTAEIFPDHQSTLQKIQVQASAGNAEMPNIIQLDTCMTATVDSVAPLVDLAPYLEKSDSLNIDDFYDTFQEEAYVRIVMYYFLIKRYLNKLVWI